MVELSFSNKKQNIQVVQDVYNRDKSEELAITNKDKAFTIMQSMKGLFKKKEGEGISITHWEQRFEPFWHIQAESYMEYKRKTFYSFEVKPEVRSVAVNGKAIKIEGPDPICQFKGEDHCVEHYTKDLITDAVQNQDKGLSKYMEFPSKKITQTEDLMGANKVVIPAQVKASYLIREMFKDLIKPIHADKIIDEKIEVTNITLYFRPIYAFEIQSNATGQTGVLEVDAITGEVKRGKIFKHELKELISEDILFEVGAELASTIIPGAGVGAIIGRELKKRRDKKKGKQAMTDSQNALEEKNKKRKARIRLK